MPSIDELNAGTPEEFVRTLSGVWEHSPWIARRAAEDRPFDSIASVQDAMWRVVCAASDQEKMDLIRAHPDLAGKLAAAKRLTPESTSEQASAGLDALTDDERAEFERLNAAYRERFGFPFIICVREHTRPEILAAFRRRIDHDASAETAEALEQIRRIANLRIHDLIAG